jgi:hypothetical protein
VPDITGTENIDPMTTSMDGIEDLPTNEEAQVPHDVHPFPSAEHSPASLTIPFSIHIIID